MLFRHQLAIQLHRLRRNCLPCKGLFHPAAASFAHPLADQRIRHQFGETAGQIAGGIGYTLHTDVRRVSAEIGYWLGHEFWGQGLGTAALSAVTGHAFRTHLELRRLYAVPFARNQASARILHKAGYRCEGTLRQSVIKDGLILDQWMYAILREEWHAFETGGAASA